MKDELVSQHLQYFFNDNTLTFNRSNPIGGLTNSNYLITMGDKAYVVSVPGRLTERIIDRQAQKENLALIKTLNISSQLVYFDYLTGIQISEYVANSYSLDKKLTVSQKENQVAAQILKEVHQSQLGFTNVFDWTKELARYEQLITEQKGAFFPDYAKHKKQLMTYFKDILPNPPLVPCHNDPVLANFLFSNEMYYLIDWEYSGLNDPIFDLATYILSANLAQPQIDDFLTTYYGETPSNLLLRQLKIYIMAQDLLWGCWALVRYYSGDNFKDYATQRYAHLCQNLTLFSQNPDTPLEQFI